MNRLVDTLKATLDVNDQVSQRLIDAGFDTTISVRLADVDALSAIPGVSKKNAQDWTKLQPRRK